MTEGKRYEEMINNTLRVKKETGVDLLSYTCSKIKPVDGFPIKKVIGKNGLVSYEGSIILAGTWFEDAKMDFPTYEQAKAELTKRIGHEWNSGLGETAIHLILSELRNEWFKKYFGDLP